MASVLAFDLPKKHSRRFFDLNDPILEEGNLEKLIDKSPRLSWEAKKKLKQISFP